MGGNEHRQIVRDSLFLLADMRIDGMSGDHRIRVRNVSAVRRGALVWIQLRNIGWVEGTVAWVQENRCGVAFREEIDPKQARAPVIHGEGPPRYVRTPLPAVDQGQMRKI